MVPGNHTTTTSKPACAISPSWGWNENAFSIFAKIRNFAKFRPIKRNVVQQIFARIIYTFSISRKISWKSSFSYLFLHKFRENNFFVRLSSCLKLNFVEKLSIFPKILAKTNIFAISCHQILFSKRILFLHIASHCCFFRIFSEAVFAKMWKKRKYRLYFWLYGSASYICFGCNSMPLVWLQTTDYPFVLFSCSQSDIVKSNCLMTKGVKGIVLSRDEAHKHQIST